MNLDASTRRLLVTLATLIATAGNKKLGLDLTPEEVLGMLGLVATYVTSSNWKQAKEAEHAGAQAAEAIITVEQANAIMEEAAKRYAEKAAGTAKALVLLLCVAIGFTSLPARAEDGPAAPPDLVCIPSAQRVNEGKAMIDCSTQNDKLKQALTNSTPLHPALVVGLVVLGVVLGGAGGYGLAKATNPQPAQ